MIKQYDRKSLENNSIPQLQYYPAIGFLRIQGPFTAQRPTDSRSIRKVFTCRPGEAPSSGRAVREADPVDAGAARLSASGHGAGPGGVDDASTRKVAGPARSRTASSWRCGGCWRARSSSCAPKENRPTSPPGQTYRISDLELASRLSFFLWSSIPDDELINLASQGQAEQSRRARAAGAAHARRSAIGGAGRTTSPHQLLYLRNLPATSPDGVFYPDWDDELRQSFQRETELFFESIMREDRNVVDLLTADYTFVNERLAQHYGIPEYLRIAVPPRDARAGAGLPPRAARAREASWRSPGRRISGRRRSSAACGCSKTSSARRRRSRRRTCRRSKTRRAGRQRF